MILQSNTISHVALSHFSINFAELLGLIVKWRLEDVRKNAAQYSIIVEVNHCSRTVTEQVMCLTGV